MERAGDVRHAFGRHKATTSGSRRPQLWRRRQRDRLREELTLAEIDRHGSKVEEFDVEGILNFAERVLPRASYLWIQASLEQRQRLQRLFFPEGVRSAEKHSIEYLRPPRVD